MFLITSLANQYPGKYKGTMNSAQQNYVYLSGWTMLWCGNKQSPIFSGLLRVISLLCNMANMSLLGSSIHWSLSGMQVYEGATILGH